MHRYQEEKKTTLTDSTFNQFSCIIFQVVKVEESSVSMLPTKVEIKMKKAEPGSWAKLETAHPTVSTQQIIRPQQPEETNKEESITAQVDAVDLSDL